jgi:uncharacterized DUF497 family protein
MPIRFEWDADKARANIEKHGVTFEEAASVFADPLSLTITDPDHSSPDEERLITLGLAINQRLLVVVHCDREDRVRVISARRATRNERNDYEEGR